MRSYNPKLVPQSTTNLSSQLANKSFNKSSTPTSSSFQKFTFPTSHTNLENNDLSTTSLAKHSSNHRTSSTADNHPKASNPKRSLVIDVEAEPQTYNIASNNRIIPHTTTNNHFSASSPKNFKNAGSINLNGTSNPRSPKYNEPMLTTTSSISPKNNLATRDRLPGNFPQSTTNHMTSNRIGSVSTTGTLDNFLNQLSPKSLHLRSTSTKTYFFESQSQSQKSSTASRNENHDVTKSSSSSHHQSTQNENTLDRSETRPNSTFLSVNLNNQPQDETNNKSGDVSLEHEDDIPFEYNKDFASIPKGPQKRVLAPIPNHEPTKCSIKRNGIVKAYAANTNQGIVRNYNEDRVSIILNIMKPASRMNEDWPKCSFFGVYDGHGGVSCADFLRDNLHQYVIKEPAFPWNPKEAIVKGFEAAEQAFLAYADSKPNGELDKSGSCAIVAVIVGETCYIVNVGDSRAVMSGEGGAKVYHLSEDHKPSEESEQKRIIEAGGKIYQTQAPAFRPVNENGVTKNQMHFLLGPHRVFPGRLSVSRTFGDIEAKYPKYGGNPNAVIATPEIRSFKIKDHHDFIVLACDGIFDKLSSQEAVKMIWDSTSERASDIHQQCGLGVEGIMRESLVRRTLDNITVVMISLKNFKHKLFPREKAKPEPSHKVSESNSSANGILLNRTLLNGSILKQNTQALKEKSNEQVPTYNTNYHYLDDKYKRANNTLNREQSPSITKMQAAAGKKFVDKESSIIAKENSITGKRTVNRNSNQFTSTASNANDENKNVSSGNNTYLDYLQHGKIMKVKSMDYRDFNFAKYLKGVHK